MKAIILAAGRGSRMGSLTEDKPKCLVMLSGAPLLSWQLHSLYKAGLNNSIIISGYKKERLNIISNIYNPRWHETNMVSSLRCARKELLTDDCIVSYSDIVYHPENIGALIQAPGDIVILYDKLWYQLWKERFEKPLEDAESFIIDEECGIIEIGKKALSLQQINGQFIGLLKFTPQGWQQAEKVINKLSQEQQDKLDMTTLFQLLIESGVEVKGQPVDGRWVEVDSESDLKLYEKKLKLPNWIHDWRW